MYFPKRHHLGKLMSAELNLLILEGRVNEKLKDLIDSDGFRELFIRSDRIRCLCSTDNQVKLII